MDRPDAIIVAHQRSGTHLLQSLLTSHPRIHGRGEFILHYRRRQKDAGRYVLPESNPHIFQNRPNFVNIAIVMYSQLSTFEELCGAITEYKIIHLLREPASVAASVAQMKADKARLGAAYRAHYHVGEQMPAAAEYTPAQVDALAATVRDRQAEFAARVAGQAQVVTVKYEDLTGNRQTNELPASSAQPLLDFLGVDYVPLVTTLRKSAHAVLA